MTIVVSGIAKMFVGELIETGKLELCGSFMFMYQSNVGLTYISLTLPVFKYGFLKNLPLPYLRIPPKKKHIFYINNVLTTE